MAREKMSVIKYNDWRKNGPEKTRKRLRRVCDYSSSSSREKKEGWWRIERNANNNKNKKHQICWARNLYRKATRGKKQHIGSSSLLWTFLLATSLSSILTTTQTTPTTIQRSNKWKRSHSSQLHDSSFILSPKSKYITLFTTQTPHPFYFIIFLYIKHKHTNLYILINMFK